MKSYELAANLKNGPGPLYLIIGEEACLRDQALALLREAVVGPAAGQPDAGAGLGAFNEDIVYGDEEGAEDLLARAGSAPVFAARRLVVVKAADKMPARETERLLPYLKAPCESTTLVFVAPKLDGRLKFGQTLNKAAAVVDCGGLVEPRLSAWIREEAARAGVRLEEDAVLCLKEVAETSLTIVQRELEKLAAYVPPDRAATAEDVGLLRGIEPGASVFDLAAAIGGRQRLRVLQILGRNLEAGEAPLRILGSLVWQYRQIWKAKEAAGQGGEAEAARMLRLPAFKVWAFLNQFSEPHVRAAFEKFLDTDARLKGGSATAPERILEWMVLELCEGEKPARTEQPAGGEPAQRRPPAKKPISNVRTVRSGGSITR